jgi:F-type H+-transporting ATPase subunit beta
VGSRPTLGTELASLEGRVCDTASGVITPVQAVYVPADNFGDAEGIGRTDPDALQAQLERRADER